MIDPKLWLITKQDQVFKHKKGKHTFKGVSLENQM